VSRGEREKIRRMGALALLDLRKQATRDAYIQAATLYRFSAATGVTAAGTEEP